MRQHALTKGYSLNEHTLSVDLKWKGAKPPAIPVLKTEAEILAFLGIKWVSPTDREDVAALTFV